MATKLTDFRATAKAWVAAALAAVTSVAAYVVPDSTPGHLLASAAAFLITLGAVFATSNGPARQAVDNRDF